jgi:predicted ATP-dependent endonuclease of OLD family
MKISKVEIENFRSIKHLVLEPKDICVLVGSNGAGKSNVLKAIDLLLGETYPTQRSFTKNDFYNREFNETIRIKLTFSETLKSCKLTNAETRSKESCEPTSLELTHTEKEDAGNFQTHFFAYDSKDKKYWASGKARDQSSFVYVPSERRLEKEMTVSQWTLLGKILKKIDDNFRAKDEGDELSEKENEFRNAMQKPRDILESDMGNKLSYKKFKEEFLESCKENTEKLANKFDLDLEIYDPLFYYKTIQIIGEDEHERRFNVEELGSGIQNLVLLSLFKTYGRLLKQTVILAIEEPEMYLYPQAQRALYSNFVDLAEDGTQIFYTTHNPNFVNAQRADEVEMLYKDIDKGTYNLEKDDVIDTSFLEENKLKIYSQFNTERNELFFAKKILLVEGASDKILFNTLCQERWDIDLDKEGFSIIECGGKSGAVYFIGVCRLLGMENFFAVWDEDKEVDDNHEHLSHAEDNDYGLEIPQNIESLLKLPEGDSADKVKNAYEWAKNRENNIPDELNRVKDFFVNGNGKTPVSAYDENGNNDNDIPF